jgi:hypothetical protein
LEPWKFSVSRLFQVKSTIMGFQRQLQILFRPLVLLGGLLVALFLMTLAVLLFYGARPSAAPVAAGTAVLNIIPAPIETPALPAPPTQAAPVEPPQDGEYFVSGSVVVSGTGGAGLRLRFTPGLESQVRLLGKEGELFQVVEGPQTVDGYTWWYLENPDDRTRRGWAVADFLKPAQTP